ncbi:ceramide synthase 2 isoform X2 [Alosa sapidissima]|uniref:ceramide synthase 2 isoform X2 n=1 Tax=Alosa sapidissima TaxID=34773 RepID=UPI001C08813E|nr:ceramide synthase 2 isoform X2 [Alosa sapidissima]
MAIRMDILDQWLWKQEYWLPPGISWEDMRKMERTHCPLPRDLLLSLPIAFAFIGLRYIFERCVAVPFSRYLGVRDRIRVPVLPSPKLEAFYIQHRPQEPSQSEMITLAKQSGFTKRQVEVWFRHRRHLDRPSSTTKFCEACWRFVFYMVLFSFGLLSLVNAPWFWDQRECWKAYPLQPVEQAHFWYYLIELGFYWSLLLCVSVDVKRKDFKEQIVHHIATIFLLGFSYCSNYIRVGTLVMLVHDSSDFLLESAKMFNYAGWKKTCDSLFVIFAVVFLVTRLVVFPSKIIHTTLILSMEVFQPFVGYYFFNVLLLVLQALHIFWAWLILRMVYKFLFLGKLDKDERSDDDSLEDEEDGEEERSSWKKREEVLNSKLASLTSSCVLNNLKHQRANSSSRLPKSR